MSKNILTEMFSKISYISVCSILLFFLDCILTKSVKTFSKPNQSKTRKEQLKIE